MSKRILLLAVIALVMAGSLVASPAAAQELPPHTRFEEPANLDYCDDTFIAGSFSVVDDYTYPYPGLSIFLSAVLNGVTMQSTDIDQMPGAPSRLDGAKIAFVLPPQTSTYQVALVLDSVLDGYLVYQSTLTATCNWDGSKFSPGAVTITNGVLTGVFAGPALPAPESRNLVLFNADTAVLDGPNGSPTGAVIKACQTAFVIGNSEDGGFGKLFVMGGWVPMANTRDVPEDYGQPGSPLAPDCVGR